MGKKGGDLTKTERINELKSQLKRGGGITAKWYETSFKMSRKTLLRDLDDLEAQGVELVKSVLDDGSIRYTESISSRRLIVPHTLEDVMALFLGRSMFDFLKGTSLQKSFGDVYKSIEKQLKGTRDIDNAKKLSKKLFHIHEGPKHYTPDVAVSLDKIIMALRHELALEVEYKNLKGEASELTIHPYTITTFRRGLYLVAAVPKWNNRILRFALERFTEVTPTGTHFSYPKEYDPAEFFESALFMETGKPVKVTLRFEGASEVFIGLRQYHSSQKLTHKRDGSLQMTLEVPTGYELVHWILSFGPNVKVVSPKSLKDDVVSQLQSTLQKYQ